METTWFCIQTHYKIMCDWLEAHGAYIPPKCEMPAIGCVVYDEEEGPVAMAFIRAVEGGFGQLDGLVTNPKAKPEVRDVAINLVVKQVLRHAKISQMKSLVSFSIDKNTLLRSLSHGFEVMPHTLIAIDLDKTAHLRQENN